jgi:hypothetical protein
MPSFQPAVTLPRIDASIPFRDPTVQVGRPTRVLAISKSLVGQPLVLAETDRGNQVLTLEQMILVAGPLFFDYYEARVRWGEGIPLRL